MGCHITLYAPQSGQHFDLVQENISRGNTRPKKGGASRRDWASGQMRQMRFRITPRFNEFAKILFAELKLDRRQLAPK